jgi:putative transposase
MAEISYRRHRFPPVVIQHAVWLYLRFTLSYLDVEELFAERGLDISCESVRSWVLKFGPVIARRLRRHRSQPSDRWHLDEMVVRIAGERPGSIFGIWVAMWLPRQPSRSRFLS